MRTPTIGLVAASLLTVPVLAAPAHAAKWTHNDAANDMMRSGSTPVLDSTQKHGDIRRVVYRHKKKKLVLKMKLGALNKKATRTYTFMIRTPKKHFKWGGSIYRTEHAHVEFKNWRTNKDVKCRISGLEKWRTRTVTVKIPRKCLGKPKWVRVDASASNMFNAVRHYDYAHVDHGGSYFNWSRKIRRG